MNKEFVKYNQALALKEKGFKQTCFGLYDNHKVLHTNKKYVFEDDESNILAPLYQQAFRWFREKHGLLHDITLTLNINDELESFYILIHKLNGLVMNEDDDIELNVKTTNKEEAESACLDKLIEICKNK